MEGNLPCAKHEEQIKTLFKQDESMDKRVGKLEDDRTLWHNMDKNIALISKSIEDINEYNKKVATWMNEQLEINVKVNENLTKLAEQYNTLNNKVDTIGNETEKLAKKVEQNENKHKIDMRDLDKKKRMELLKKYGEPIVIIGAIGTILLKLIEIFKG